MKNILEQNGEIDLLVDQKRIVPSDDTPTWQIDKLIPLDLDHSYSSKSAAYIKLDSIVTQWLNNLSREEWIKIKRQRTLNGISLPNNWIKTWRGILRDARLRDPERIIRNGNNIGSAAHLWTIWAQDCISKYLNDLDKDLLKMVDSGMLYEEIGVDMLVRYGNRFWKKRKDRPTTTPGQVVNNYLHHKLPFKIVRQELLDICLKVLDKN